MQASKTKSRKRQAADLTIATYNSCSQLTCTQRGGCSPGREIEFSYMARLLFMLMRQSQIKHCKFCTTSFVNLPWSTRCLVIQRNLQSLCSVNHNAFTIRLLRVMVFFVAFCFVFSPSCSLCIRFLKKSDTGPFTEMG